MENLVERVVESMKRSIDSRHEAADVLRKVAELGQAGCFPSDVTSEELGQALFRIMMNAPEENPFVELVKGYHAAENRWHERLLNAALGR